MKQNNQADKIRNGNDPKDKDGVTNDTDRFYILMKTLYSTVDPDELTMLSECRTRDELRRTIEARAAKVKAALKTQS